MLRAAFLLALLTFPAFAQQPQRPPDPIPTEVQLQMRLEETLLLLAERRDQLARSERDADARLKWVLDNWVGKK